MKRILTMAALLALAGCNTAPMSDAQRAMLFQHLQNQQAQQNQLMREIAQPTYQIVQPQPVQAYPYQSQPIIQAPIQTTCVRRLGQVDCTTY